jgi:hypothetical protein
MQQAVAQSPSTLIVHQADAQLPILQRIRLFRLLRLFRLGVF